MDETLQVGLDRVGGVFLVGRSGWDLEVAKIDAYTGRTLWIHTLGTGVPGTYFSYSVSGLAIDVTGHVVVSGTVTGAPFITKLNGVSGASMWPGSPSGVDPSGSLLTDAQGNVYLTSSSQNAGVTSTTLVELDSATGMPVWQSPAIVDFAAGPMGLTLSGDVVATGTDRFFRAEAVRISRATSSIVWTSKTGQQNSYVTKVAFDAGGNLFLLETDLVKLDAETGVVLWRFPGNFTDLSIDGDGSAFVAGVVWHENNPYTDTAVWKVRGDTGLSAWPGPSTYDDPDGSYDEPRSIVVDAVGNAFLAAFIGTSTGSRRSIALKYDSATGNALWPTPSVFSGVGSALNPRLMTIASPGNVDICGESYADGYPMVFQSLDGPTGEPRWATIPSIGRSVVDVAADPLGNLIVAELLNAGFGNLDIGTEKLSAADGSSTWFGPKTLAGSQGKNDFARDLAADANGNVVVTGQVWDANFYDTVTVKYSAAGTVVWRNTFDSGGTDNPWGVVLDSSGNAFVAGQLGSSAGVLKLNGNTGTLVWPSPSTIPRSNLGAYDLLRMAVNASGDVFVSLPGYDDIGNPAYAISKFNGSTGAVLWTVSKPSDLAFSSHSLGIDGSGNVVFSWSGGGGGDNPTLYTQKLDGGTGAPLWPMPVTYPGQQYRRIYPAGLTLDGSGNPTVVAQLADFFNDRTPDYYVLLRYAGFDGSLLDPPLVVKATAREGVVAASSLEGDTVVLVSSSKTIRYTDKFVITNLASAISSAFCGVAYRFQFSTQNGKGIAPTFSRISGTLPPGLTLAAGGLLSGTPTKTGAYTFTVRARDAIGQTFDRAFMVEVGPSTTDILTTANPVCSGTTATLSVAGAWASYLWQPGGETSSTINVSPTNPTTYGVLVTDAGGCQKRGDITVNAAPAPTRASVGGPQTICPNGTTASLGGNPEAAAAGVWSIVTPGVTGTFSPSTGYPNATFTETNGVTGPIVLRWTVSTACGSSFADVTIQIPGDTTAPGVTAPAPWTIVQSTCI